MLKTKCLGPWSPKLTEPLVRVQLLLQLAVLKYVWNTNMYRIPGTGVQGTGIYLQRSIFSVQEHSGYGDSRKLNHARELQCLSE